jgi:hypothetical protein
LLFGIGFFIIQHMKIKIALTALAVLFALQVQSLAGHALSAGARYHMRHSEYVELPFDDGDISYLLGYEYHEANAFWQLLVGYAPDISEGDDGRGTGVNAVITPQINLLFKDRNWLGGVGALASYIEMEDENGTESDWTDVYWQLMLGFELPLPVLDIEVMAYYPFEKWKTLSDFDAGDIEFGVLLKFKF